MNECVKTMPRHFCTPLGYIALLATWATVKAYEHAKFEDSVAVLEPDTFDDFKDSQPYTLIEVRLLDHHCTGDCVSWLNGALP